MSRREAGSDKRVYQTVSGAIIVTAGGRRDNCASGLPGAWFCAGKTRHYIAPRSLPGVMMRRGQTALPAGQPPGLCVIPLAQPWVGGGSKRGSRAASAEPGSGIAAAQQAGGGQGPDWSPVFFFQQAAPGAVCFICAGSQRKSVRTG